MTFTRKLVTVSLLLTGGYSLALLFTSVSDFFSLRAAIPVGSTTDHVVVKPADDRWTAANHIELLPQHDTPQPTVIAEAPPTQASPPAWLTAAPILNPAGHTADATTVAADSNSASPDASTSSNTSDRPRARITDITPTAATTTTASPWDRWPPWDATQAVGKSGVVTANQTLPAAFQAPEPSRVPAVQTAFDAPTIASRIVPTTAPFEPTTLRTHIVIDGDSLARLAERYLGDPQRGEEIFRLNRDLLTNPELLPIGVELRIPERTSKPMQTAIAAPALSNVPQPSHEAPSNTNNAPRAQLLNPVAAGREGDSP